MRHCWQWTGLVLLVLCVGCNSRLAPFAVQGEVSFMGQAVKWGKIDFVPIEQTPGASAAATITDGHYEIPAKWGLLPDGVYAVRIRAFRKTGRKQPNRIERGGPPVDVTENFIPAIYNDQSTLKVRVADLPDKDHVDFRLGKLIRLGRDDRP